ncbi:hypothetical protein EC919_104209 [Pseudomonas graminis]|uniref:hypothetical protein n=1 Tax=Pseudomonas graminis TaxID=158627 RepID=UPI001061C0B0|nr:hypothetical protein [Pseudomonas graminis]TDV54473.1 hypothetical protein EC919_104209 [Pseudomonas graminis]
MARASASDATKGAATAANTTAASSGQQTSAEGTTATAAAAGVQSGTAVGDSASVAGAGTGPLQPTDPANGIGNTVQAGQPSEIARIDADSATAGTATISFDTQPGTGDQVQADSVAEDSNEIMIYPVRSYLDGKEIRRAGGEGYKSPKHDAVSLVAAGLATDKKPKA